MSSHRNANNAEAGDTDKVQAVQPSVLEPFVSPFDMKRLDSYARNLVDFHLVLDLVPGMAQLYFDKLPQNAFTLSPV